VQQCLTVVLEVMVHVCVQVHLEFTIPARGLIGLRTRMLTATQGG